MLESIVELGWENRHEEVTERWFREDEGIKHDLHGRIVVRASIDYVTRHTCTARLLTITLASGSE